MKALIIGGNGFLGSHLVDRLLMAGDSVRVLDVRPERFRQPLPAVQYFMGDMGNSFLLSESLHGVDVVYHLASSAVPGTSNLNPAKDVQDNLVGTVNLLEEMRKVGVRRILFLSSGGTVYGVPETIPVAEDHPLRPLCSYGIVKAAVEKYLFMYERLYGFSAVVLRPSNLYGERQAHLGVQGIIATFLNKILRGEAIEVWGDGTVMRDYLHVADMVDLLFLAGRSPIQGIFNAGSGVGHSVNDIISVISDVTGSAPPVIYRDARSFDIKQIILDAGRADDAFGWKARISLRQGIENQWNWLRDAV